MPYVNFEFFLAISRRGRYSITIEPGRRNQGRELCQKLQRLEHDMRRAVAPSVSETVQQPAISQGRQALRSHSRTPRISAEIFQLAAGFSWNADVCVQADFPCFGNRKI